MHFNALWTHMTITVTCHKHEGKLLHNAMKLYG